MGFYGYGEAEGVDYSLISAGGPRGPGAEQLVHGVSGVSFVAHGNTIPSDPARWSAQVRRAGGRDRTRSAAGSKSATAARRTASSRWSTCSAWRTERCAGASGKPSAMRRSSAPAWRRATSSPRRPHRRGTSCARTGSPTRAGCYEGRVPTGTYQVAASKEGYPVRGQHRDAREPPRHDHERRKRHAGRRAAPDRSPPRQRGRSQQRRGTRPRQRRRLRPESRDHADRDGDQRQRHQDPALLRPHRPMRSRRR